MALGIDRLGASAIVSVPCTRPARGPDRILQPDLDRIPHSGCGTVRDQGAGRLIDLLQIVVSIVFTRFMALFQHTITCQSVLCLPATRTKREMAHCGGWTAFVRLFSCNLSSVFICTKRAAFLLPHGKNAALFQMLILRWILQFDLAEHVKIIPIWMRAVRAGACGRASDHAGRWQIRAPARWTGGHSRGRIALPPRLSRGGRLLLPR